MSNKYINYSFIIPHYTKTDTHLLERCVKSIPDRDDIEVLVVDNSPNEIDSKLFDFRANTYILYSEKGKGAGCARNKGLQHATGKWLIFMDSDDYLTSDAFVHFDQYLNDNSDIIYFKTTSINNSTGKESKRHCAYNRLIEEYEKRISLDNGFKLRVMHYVPWGKMIKRELVCTNGFTFDEVPASNDVVFCTKTGLAAKRINVDYNIVYCTTVTDGSLTRTKNLKIFPVVSLPMQDVIIY